MNLQLLTNIIEHARISSAIGKRLTTVKGLRRPLDDMIKTVHELEEQLQSWKESLPPLIRPGTDIKHNNLPSRTHLSYVLYLRFAYLGSLTAIHSIFFYPWNLPRFGADQNPALATQIVLSTEAVVEASRNIILTTKQIEVDASSPIW